MRRISILMAGAVMLLAVAATAAQSQSTARPGQRGLAVFGGLDARFGDMAGEFAAFAGAEVALLLKRQIYVGIRGAGLVTDNLRVAIAGSTGTRALRMGYGGVLVGYVVRTPGSVEVALDATLGGGAAGTGDPKDWDPVFVFEPSARVNLRLAPVLRLGIGASYRFVGDATVSGVDESDLRGLSGVVALRVGRF